MITIARFIFPLGFYITVGFNCHIRGKLHKRDSVQANVAQNLALECLDLQNLRTIEMFPLLLLFEM